MKLNETQIKKIIRKVISEGAFTQLKRSPVLNITDDQVLAWYFYDVSVHLENDYDVEHFDGTKIPDFIKPYMDEIVDGIDFEKLKRLREDKTANQMVVKDNAMVILRQLKDQIYNILMEPQNILVGSHRVYVGALLRQFFLH